MGAIPVRKIWRAFFSNGSVIGVTGWSKVSQSTNTG
jgi:hypothetical protein